MRRVVFHADLDAFFASVEQLDRRELRGHPVIVGALPGHRGVVSACSYEARAFGVRSAMPISRAVALCPRGIFLPVRMSRYREVSNRIMAIFGDFSSEVRQISVDEAFLEMSGTETLFGPPAVSAQALKDRVRSETGLAVSVGVASNRYLAKLASARSKPDGLLMVEEGGEETFMSTLPLEKVWGIGEVTLRRLQGIGLDTVEAIRSLPEDVLRRAVGSACGAFLYAAVRGRDPGVLNDETRSRSISAETTFEHDVLDPEVLEATVLALSQELMFRLLEGKLSSRTVHVKLRYDDFETVSVQETLDRPVSTAEDIRSAALALLARRRDSARAVRLIGVGLGNVDNEEERRQGELFDDGSAKLAAVERAVLDLKRKKGALVTRARLVGPGGKKGH